MPTRGRNNRASKVTYPNPLTRTLFTGPVLRGLRGGTYLHVSDLIYRCIRKKALSQKLRLPVAAEELWDSQSITFRLGEAIGDFVVDRAIDRDGRVFGRWKCRCGRLTPNMLREDALKIRPCRRCGGYYDQYAEFHLTNDQYALVGNCDLALMWDQGLYLNEVKSINADGFDALDTGGPHMDHIVQLLFYSFMAREMGYEIYDRGSIFYVKKEFKIGSPYKEFKLVYEDHAHHIEPYLEEAMHYARFLQDGTLPERIMCNNIDEPTALKCQFCLDCFRYA